VVPDACDRCGDERAASVERVADRSWNRSTPSVRYRDIDLRDYRVHERTPANVRPFATTNVISAPPALALNAKYG
jgi:hypothetical protein